MQRRDFLRLGGTSFAGLTFASAMPMQGLLRRPSARVRYAEDWNGPFVDALLLSRGDPELLQAGVRLTVLGLPPRDAGWGGRASLDVLFPQVGWQAPFHAWRHDGIGIAGSARLNSFLVPLDDAGRLRLEPSWNDVAFPVALTAGSEPGLAKLRTGLYLLSAPGSAPLVAAVESAQSAPRSLEPWRNAHV